MRFLLGLVLLFAFSDLARAQVDPSSALLLNSGSRGSNRESGLDSGRYTVRPRENAPARRSEERAARRSQSTDAQSAQPAHVEGADDGSLASPQEARTESSGAHSQVGKAVPTPVSEPAKTESTREEQTNSVEGSDSRLSNLLEISIAPAFIYNSSDSSFFYRHYQSSAPAISVEANVWLNPLFSVNTSYMSTLSGDVNDSFDGSRHVSASQQWFTAGIRSRRVVGGPKELSYLLFGIDYYEFQFRVPSDSVLRERLSSSGVRLSLESELASSPRHAWTVGFSLMPKLQHKEQSTAIDFQSGANVDANAVGLSVGSRFTFDRASSIFWKLSHTIEKDLFTGDATVADPVSGITPSGVSVTNSFTIFQVGYTWGN